MEKKFKVSEFATVIGVAKKTIYELINKNELITVNELENGRQITVITTNDEQISVLQKRYSKTKVNNGDYYETVTENNSKEPTVKPANQDIITNLMDKFLEISNKYSEKIDKVNEELITYKVRIPLLEDKASREGMYTNKIKELETENTTVLTENKELTKNNSELLKVNNHLKQVNNRFLLALISVIILLVLTASVATILLVIEHNKPPKIITVDKVTEKIIEKPIVKYIKK